MLQYYYIIIYNIMFIYVVYWISSNIISREANRNKGNIELSRKFVPFLRKIQRQHFYVSLFIYSIMYSPVYSTTFLHLSCNFKIPSFLGFSIKNTSQNSFMSKEFKSFPLRDFCKDLNKWNSKGAMSGKYSGWGNIF